MSSWKGMMMDEEEAIELGMGISLTNPMNSVGFTIESKQYGNTVLPTELELLRSWGGASLPDLTDKLSHTFPSASTIHAIWSSRTVRELHQWHHRPRRSRCPHSTKGRDGTRGVDLSRKLVVAERERERERPAHP